jgi:hypothetical protein
VSGRPSDPPAQSGNRSGAPDGRPIWYEVADALWLAGQQLAAARSAEQDEPVARAAQDLAPRERPPASAAPVNGTAPLSRPVPPGAQDPGTHPAEGNGDARARSRPVRSVHSPEPLRPAPPTWSSAPHPGGDPFAGVTPLPGQRHITQALRPFKRLVESHHGEKELDDEETADRAARDDLWWPVFHPVRERWLDLDLVVDDGRFASLHRPLVHRFVDSVLAVGAFRVIRVHLLNTDVPEPDLLTLRSTDPAGPEVPATDLAGLGPRDRLILTLTDGVGDAWHSTAAQQVLAGWGHLSPVAIVHLLPRRHWRRTGLVTRPARLRTPAAAVANRRYRTLHSGSAAAAPTGLPIPLVEMDAGQLSGWARFITASSPGWYGAVVDYAARTVEQAGTGNDLGDDEQELTAAAQVRRFRAAASPTVFALAVHLAAAPLNVPVMRLVQHTMLPGSKPADLSELVGSGLLQRVGPGIEVAHQVTYDYCPGVRAELLAAGRRSDTTKVLMTVADHVGDRVRVLRELRDMVMAPHLAEVPALTPDTVPFAEPTLHALRALAGPYLQPAQDLHAALLDATSRTADDAKTTERNHQSILTQDRPEETAHVGINEPMQTLNNYRSAEEQADATTHTPFTGVGVTIRTIPAAAERGPSDPPPVWGNVPPQNRTFTGREELLEELHRRLSQGTTAVLPEALHGMGGVGKSQIAIEYVYRHIQDYDLIWWIPAERPGQIQQGLAELATQLGLPVSQEVNVAVPAVLEALRLGRPYRDWLLVFDNAEQLDEVRDFFPTNGSGKILVTSRNHAWTSVAGSLEVDVFAREESKDLLRLRGPELADLEADELAQILGDLPLAIEQAAVWLAETGMPVAEYLHLFREKHDQAAELLHDAAPFAYELPVAAAWNVSLDQLRTSDPAALQLLQVCAFFAPEPISRRLLSGPRNVEGPPELMEALADPVKLGRAIRAINQYALAKISHRDNTIMLHRLVQRVLVGQMTPQEAAELRHCGHQLLAKGDPNAPDISMHWQQYADLLPHVLYSDLVDCDDAWARQLVLNQIDFLFQWGDHQGFLTLAQKTVDTWTEKLGEDHEQTLSAGLHLGRALRLHGQFTEAYEHHVRVRDVLAANHGMEDERTLEAQRFVGGDLRYLGEFGQALELDRQCFEIVQRRFGRDDPTTLQQAHLYAVDLRLTGDAEQARQLDRDTYQRLVALLGEDHVNTLGSLAGVAVDEMECGNFLEARKLLWQHTQRVEKVYGVSSPGLAEGFNTLSVMERKAGNHQRALELSVQALTLYQGRYGPGHPGSIAAALNHAVNLRQMGKLAESIPLAQETIQRYHAMFGPRHPNTPTANVNLAVALRLDGRLTEARELDETALAILTEVLGPDHPRSIVCSINLASDLFALGDFQNALELDRQSLERVRRVMGEDHPTALACALNHALDLRAVGEETEAETRFAETTARLRRILGDSHPATISAHQSIRADCDIYPIPV